MLLRSSVKGTISHVTDSILLNRDSNQDPDRYRANSIHDSNKNNSNNNVDGLMGIMGNNHGQCIKSKCLPDHIYSITTS